MDLRKVKKLIELLEESTLAEMEITEGESTIRLSRGTTSPGILPAQTSHITSHITADAVPSGPNQAITANQINPELDGNAVESPMVGTYFNSSSPDAEPYVSVGTEVKPGDVLCIIEAMKTFNQLEADVAGTIKAVYKSNGDPVEFGEPLFLID
jgi:acetyl-CoA carboxylase biotin carboxyl carrier protein